MMVNHHIGDVRNPSHQKDEGQKGKTGKKRREKLPEYIALNQFNNEKSFYPDIATVRPTSRLFR